MSELTMEHRIKADAWLAAHPKRPAERVDIDAGGHPDRAPAEPPVPHAVAMMCGVETLGAEMDKKATKRETAWPADMITAHKMALTRATDDD
jgi:hypothetical protein